nr:DNA polymerase III subunit gamma and tau [Nocardioides sp. MAH-18]
MYRRYRPETFAEVIGQDHVTEPLRAALANNRVNHAYLFSGPRGCGKTTSARILARALNCEQAPIADPCGECDSCRDLARGGPGSIDVIEIDAASHGGVDDARDLREKAFFAPVRSRYKVYIIDEAHMVTTQGFNALLKLVEEPPPHLRFIFATTEPEKVLPTIRSRTHHYPFRLIPPRLLSSYLGELCDKEGVSIEPAALPLVVRAGGGSARDTLSVLDQLLGGAGPQGVTYDLATGLLGYTPDTLLDDVVDAFAAGDGAAVFGVVDKVIETGQDPRRFTEDLLRRLRDLVIVAAVPDAPATGLIDVSEDQGERLVAQAARFGPSELTRAADLVATGLTEMRGATAPRLLLELLCARVLLPGADDATDGVLARLDRLEKRMSISGGAPTPTVAAPAPPAQDRPAPPVDRPSAPDPAAARPEPAQPSRPTVEPVAESAPTPTVEAPDPVVEPPAPEPEPAPAAPAASGGLTLVDVRRLWPDIVDRTKGMRRLAWMHLTQNCQVVSVDGSSLTLGFTNAGARDSFVSAGCDDVLRQAAVDIVGASWKIETIVDPGATPESAPTVTRSAVAEAPSAPEPAAPAAPAPESPPPWDPPAEEGGPSAIAAAREAIQQTRSADQEREPAGTEWADADAEAHPDDVDADHQGMSTAELLQRELGAQMIEEIRHQ